MNLSSYFLFRYVTECFGTSITDAETTENVKSSQHLGEDSGNWIRNKFPTELLKPIRNIQSRGRNLVKKHGSPYAAMLIRHRRRREAIEAIVQAQDAKLRAAVDLLSYNYRAIVEDRREKLNGTFDINDYPGCKLENGIVEVVDVAQFKAEFSLGLRWYPVPSQDQFLNELNAEWRDTMLEQHQSELRAAQNEPVQRMAGLLQDMVSRMGNDKSKNLGALVIGVREQADLMRDMNLSGDAGIISAADAITALLADVNPDNIRDSKGQRAALVEGATTIVSTYNLGRRSL